MGPTAAQSAPIAAHVSNTPTRKSMNRDRYNATKWHQSSHRRNRAVEVQWIYEPSLDPVSRGLQTARSHVAMVLRNPTVFLG